LLALASAIMATFECVSNAMWPCPTGHAHGPSCQCLTFYHRFRPLWALPPCEGQYRNTTELNACNTWYMHRVTNIAASLDGISTTSKTMTAMRKQRKKAYKSRELSMLHGQEVWPNLANMSWNRDRCIATEAEPGKRRLTRSCHGFWQKVELRGAPRCRNASRPGSRLRPHLLSGRPGQVCEGVHPLPRPLLHFDLSLTLTACPCCCNTHQCCIAQADGNGDAAQTTPVEMPSELPNFVIMQSPAKVLTCRAETIPQGRAGRLDLQPPPIWNREVGLTCSDLSTSLK
jgi:hypothetical protein